ncbi:MAG: hypothetical protein ISS45_01670 [Candidatus Omnitrophica bacterium]|nr:hypothetical protein [Candidatus Omnitrophota bacterium]
MPKVYSKEIKQEARNLRNRGCSLGEISLKMSIPKNTLSGWVRDIQLTKSQRKRIKEKEITCAAMGRSLAVKVNRIKIEKWKQEIRNKVRGFSKLPFQNKKMAKLICGIMYLCEGQKYPASRYLSFSNTDPKAIHIFLSLLKKGFLIRENKLRCHIGYRWDQDFNKLRLFWSNVTHIAEHQFFKSSPDKRTRGKPTRKLNYKGVCSIIYYDTNIQMELQSIGEAIMDGGPCLKIRDTEARRRIR